MQLDFIQRIWRTLDEEHQIIQSEILQILMGKLTTANSKLDSVLKKGDKNQTTQGKVLEVKRWKYTAHVKQCLDEAILDLDRWQKMFDPSWFLIMKVANPVIDKELIKQQGLARHESGPSVLSNANSLRDALREEPQQKVSIFLPGDGLKSALVRNIKHSSAKYVRRAGEDRWLLVDSIPCDLGKDKSLVIEDVRTLARKLSCADPFTFGILQCQGVIRAVSEGSRRISSFDFVFRIPGEFTDEPTSLRILIASHLDHTLTERFKLAKQLAKSISYIHTLGFVHKNVRPETVLRFDNKGSGLGSFVLIGFEKVRMADGRTLRQGDSAWEKNLYRHPYRQGLKPEEVYTMQHDIYSLGVCLLEIGLWGSFVKYQDDGTVPVLGEALDIAPGSPELETPRLMKDHLVALAKRSLPRYMGDIYKEIVVNCLTCLDEDNADFGDQSEFEDKDGVLVGVRYIEKVC